MAPRPRLRRSRALLMMAIVVLAVTAVSTWWLRVASVQRRHPTPRRVFAGRRSDGGATAGGGSSGPDGDGGGGGRGTSTPMSPFATVVDATISSRPTRTSCPVSMDDDVFRDRTHELPWEPRTVASKAATALTPVIVRQLESYNGKVLRKLVHERPPGWLDYLYMSNTERRVCQLDVAPECAIFEPPERPSHTVLRRLTTIREAAAAMGNNSGKWMRKGDGLPATEGGDGDHSAEEAAVATSTTLLFSKCCHEHAALRRALRCWQRFALGSALPTDRGSSSSRNISAASEHAQQKRSDTNATWWLAFGTLLGAVRAALEGRPATVIPWDTDVDLMLEPGTVLSVGLERAMQRGGRIGGCPTRLADPETRQHTHGTLLGFIYGTEAEDREELKDVGQGRPRRKRLASIPTPLCESCSRIELWLRNEARKTQHAADIFPLRPWTLYDMPVWVPWDAPSVLLKGYGAQWCLPCKHRTSACKNVSLRGGGGGGGGG